MRILLWHVHGSWTTAFVQGRHDYVIPVLPGRGPDGRGRARTWVWPESTRELPPEALPDAGIDVVVLQRSSEIGLVRRWLGRTPGRDLPGVYLEHDAPQGPANELRHPVADRPDLLLVHVTHFNNLMWDAGTTPTRVIEHGVVDPGHRYDGSLARAAVVVNEPVRRGRNTGTDLIPYFDRALGVDLFGMRTEALGGTDLPQDRLHEEMARRRLYLHTTRSTSLGLSLVEAMHLGMPVLALATTEAPRAVPPETGVVSARPEELAEAGQRLMADPARARSMGAAAREAALTRYGLKRFLDDWDVVLEEAWR